MPTIVVFDIEATCEQRELDPKREYPMECIEIGAVKIRNNVIVDSFKTFIKPTKVDQLTQFCTDLTGIKYEDLKDSPSFSEAMIDFYYFVKDCYIYSCGDFDKKFLLKELDEKSSQFEERKLKDIKNQIAGLHKNLKTLYSQISGNKPAGMSKMASSLNVEMTGSAHRAYDDAKNLGKIYIKLQEVREQELKKHFESKMKKLVRDFSKSVGIKIHFSGSYSDFFDFWKSGFYIERVIKDAKFFSEKDFEVINKYSI